MSIRRGVLVIIAVVLIASLIGNAYYLLSSFRQPVTQNSDSLRQITYTTTIERTQSVTVVEIRTTTSIIATELGRIVTSPFLINQQFYGNGTLVTSIPVFLLEPSSTAQFLVAVVSSCPVCSSGTEASNIVGLARPSFYSIPTTVLPFPIPVPGNPTSEISVSAITVLNANNRTGSALISYTLAASGESKGYYSFGFAPTCGLEPLIAVGVGDSPSDLNYTLIQQWYGRAYVPSCFAITTSVSVVGFFGMNYTQVTIASHLGPNLNQTTATLG